MIFFGSDHAGFILKKKLIHYIKLSGILIKDCGGHSNKESINYPEIASKVIIEFKKKNFLKNSFSVLICSSGIGMSISANRFVGIRAITCHTLTEAIKSTTHNNANVLCLGSKEISLNESKKILKLFLQTKKTNVKRHLQRIKKIDNLI